MDETAQKQTDLHKKEKTLKDGSLDEKEGEMVTKAQKEALAKARARKSQLAHLRKLRARKKKKRSIWDYYLGR